MRLGHISASVQYIFTSLNSTRSTPTSALQSLAVPTISTSVERQPCPRVKGISDNIQDVTNKNCTKKKPFEGGPIAPPIGAAELHRPVRHVTIAPFAPHHRTAANKVVNARETLAAVVP